MKALLYKDFLTIRRTLKLPVLALAVLCILPITDIYLSGLCLVIAWTVTITLFSWDERDKWDQTAAILPYSALSVVLSRYLVGWLATAFAAGCFLLGQLVLFPTKDPAAVLALGGSFAAEGLLFQALFLPWVFLLGITRSRPLLAAMFFVCFLMLWLWMLVTPIFFFDCPAWNTALLQMCLALVISAFSLLLACHLYQRREDTPIPSND